MIKEEQQNNTEEKIKTFSRSSSLSLKFNNQHRKEEINIFISEYQRVAENLVSELWREYGFDENSFEEKLPKFIDNNLYVKYGIETWLSERAKQCLGKQVLGIIKGTIKKQKERNYRIETLKEEGKFKQARKLQKIFDEQTISCPSCINIFPQLSEQCFKGIKINDDICWITIASIKNTSLNKNPEYDFVPKKIDLCFKLHKQYKNLSEKALKRNNSILITPKKIQFTFEFEDITKKKDVVINPHKIIGVDIGVKTAYSCSNQNISIEDKDGWDYDKILDKLSRKKRGSKNFLQASRHRKQYLQWVVKRLGIENASLLVRENIKDMYRGKNVQRKLKHFNYKLIFDVLDNYCQTSGVRVSTVNQRYTSQRCSACGYVHKRNRNGKRFVCKKCGFISDADLNASVNISLQLKKLTKEQCKPGKNRKGFYWDSKNVSPVIGSL